uniref:Uncharacterized protein n=1 Tax=Cucumis sativus TaxID=3659 RepID=A0A0A0LSS3_CUCSA
MGMTNKVRFKTEEEGVLVKQLYKLLTTWMNPKLHRYFPPTQKLVAIAMAPTEPSISDQTVQICLTTYTFFRRLIQPPTRHPHSSILQNASTKSPPTSNPRTR